MREILSFTKEDYWFHHRNLEKDREREEKQEEEEEEEEEVRSVVDTFLNFIFSRANDLYLCLYNQLFGLLQYVFKFLTL